MQKFNVELEGISPYLQHRMDDLKLEEWEKNRKLIIERDDIAKEDIVRAEFHCYRNKANKCFIPCEHLRGAFIQAGTFQKAKVGARTKSMKSIVAGMFEVSPEEIELPNYDDIDKRSAVNNNVKGRVIVIRPKWSKWKAKFVLLVDNDTLTKETIKQIIEYAGQYIGIGSFRPQRNGRFGRFILKKFTSCSS
jgi:hypothetical protein